MVLGDPSGDLQLVTLVALIALARTFGVNLRTRELMKNARVCTSMQTRALPATLDASKMRWRGQPLGKVTNR